jgi:hypothetical protein
MRNADSAQSANHWASAGRSQAHHDPRLFTWVLASMARRLVSAPEVLFHGNAFYPYGESRALSEPLLIPSLLGLPGFMTGNPVLTYNLLLLLLWPLNGVAMAWVAYQLTGSRPAAWLAGAVFCLSPYFTEPAVGLEPTTYRLRRKAGWGELPKAGDQRQGNKALRSPAFWVALGPVGLGSRIESA